MITLSYDKYNARGYTDAFLNYLHEVGYEIPTPLESIFYWLSDDDVEEFARVNFDIEFTNEEDEDEGEDLTYIEDIGYLDENDEVVYYE